MSSRTPSSSGAVNPGICRPPSASSQERWHAIAVPHRHRRRQTNREATVSCDATSRFQDCSRRRSKADPHLPKPASLPGAAIVCSSPSCVGLVGPVTRSPFGQSFVSCMLSGRKKTQILLFSSISQGGTSFVSEKWRHQTPPSLMPGSVGWTKAIRVKSRTMGRGHPGRPL